MLYDSKSTRRSTPIDLLHDTVPDVTAILKFRHLREVHQPTAQMFAGVKSPLEERKLLLKAGISVDVISIGTANSTKNATQNPDPEMRQTKKGNRWYFGLNLHVGTDRRGVIHVADHDRRGDVGHRPAPAAPARPGDSAARRQGLLQGGGQAAVGTQWRALPGEPRGKRTARGDASNRTCSRVRAMAEYGFLLIRRLWAFTKVRYRGLAKNTVRAYALCALANLYRMRYTLAPQGT